MSRPWSAGLQPQEGSPSCGTVSGQDLHSHWCLSPHYAFCVEFSDPLFGKAHFLEYLPRVLAQQRGRPTWHDLSIPKAYVVPRQPQPSYHRMLVYDKHIIGRGVRIIEEEFTVSFHCRCTRDTCLLQARQTLCQRQASKTLREGLG